MLTFLVSAVILTALSSSCASPEQLLTCNDLARIQRGTEEALKEIAQTQRQKKEDQCQTLDENQAKVNFAIGKLEGRLEQGLNDCLALNQMERGRLDDIEAKVDTQMDKLSSSLKTMQTSSEERLQAIEDSLEAMQEQLAEVATRPACQPPFERVGDDCVHLHDVRTPLADARRYCQALGGDLLEHADKRGFVLDGVHFMSVPHPPLFDLLERKRRSLGYLLGIRAWVGASVDGDGNEATWTSGQALRGDYGIDPLECIAVSVWRDGTYATGSVGCGGNFYSLCHRL